MELRTGEISKSNKIETSFPSDLRVIGVNVTFISSAKLAINKRIYNKLSKTYYQSINY